MLRYGNCVAHEVRISMLSTRGRYIEVKIGVELEVSQTEGSVANGISRMEQMLQPWRVAVGNDIWVIAVMV